MRVHISLDEALVAELDERVGARRRSGFIAQAVARALEDERRWELIESSLGTTVEGEWADDPGAWVRGQRRFDETRVG